MYASPAFSPLQTNHGEKYHDRPRGDVIGLLDFPWEVVAHRHEYLTSGGRA